ncbi:AMP-binding enzyme domain protein [Burkholderia pseudomallei]|nr:AMP-binding enzyme domain protein [Burkholderia pseudomallei]KGD50990.1 putative aMP-binding enzyme domain protein [Burkholderia pseudomallei]
MRGVACKPGGPTRIGGARREIRMIVGKHEPHAQRRVLGARDARRADERAARRAGRQHERERARAFARGERLP